ncbi:PEP-CTERM sorting domain-containing protein [Nostoc sp.]|uniref:PEP-CTERM sorting domain-containing protein n=1 Tax=Nostoc sp. TaxID=1180 RepID=UPI002FF94D18
MTKNNRKKAVVQAIFTAVALGLVTMQVESAQAATLTVNNLDNSGVRSLRDAINIANSNDVVEFLLDSNLSTITLTSGALAIANDSNVTVLLSGGNLLVEGGSIIVDNSGEINAGSNNGGSISITSGNLILTRVPEPSAIAGVILAGGLAWLAKRKQTPLCKAKV